MENILTVDGKGYSAQKKFLEWDIQNEGEILSAIAYNWARRHELASWIIQHKDSYNTGSDCPLEEIILDEVESSENFNVPVRFSENKSYKDKIFIFFNDHILQKI